MSPILGITSNQFCSKKRNFSNVNEGTPHSFEQVWANRRAQDGEPSTPRCCLLMISVSSKNNRSQQQCSALDSLNREHFPTMTIPYGPDSSSDASNVSGRKYTNGEYLNSNRLLNM